MCPPALGVLEPFAPSVVSPCYSWVVETSIVTLALTVCEFPCAVCDLEVLDDQHGLLCEVCCNWSHRSCVNMSVEEYFRWANIDDGWVCPKCNEEAFSFYNTSHLSSTISLSTSSTMVSATSQRDPSLLKILLLNARSLLPKINHLRRVCLSESFDVIVTWLSRLTFWILRLASRDIA